MCQVILSPGHPEGYPLNMWGAGGTNVYLLTIPCSLGGGLVLGLHTLLLFVDFESIAVGVESPELAAL